MTWLDQRPVRDLGSKLEGYWKRGGILRIPGAHDPLTGILARDAGFEALYLSGAAVTAARGLPDLGILTMDELVEMARNIVRVTGLPLIVDGDTGYGEILNTMRLVRELEDVGAAAVQLEDQVLPKKCGHLNGKQLVSPEQMAEKIAAAVKARCDLKIIARTDAAAMEGVDAAIARAKLYIEAGADAIFPEALGDRDAFRAFADAISVPLLANMTEFGNTPQTSAAEFEQLGYSMVIWPVSTLRIAAKAIEEFLAELSGTGSAATQLSRMQPRSGLYTTIGYYDYENLDTSIQKTVLTAHEVSQKAV